MREPTRLTRPLQIGLAAYFDLFWFVAWVLALPVIGSAIATGQRLRATAVLSSLGLWTAVFALLTYGGLEEMALDVLGVPSAPRLGCSPGDSRSNQTAVALFSDLISGLIAAVLLVASVVGLVRFGPWAMKKPQ